LNGETDLLLVLRVRSVGKFAAGFSREGGWRPETDGARRPARFGRFGGILMKKAIFLTIALATSLGLAGCGYTPEQRAVNGAVVGGATGAVVGGLASGRAGGALAGGILGAAAGGIIGANTAPPPPPRRCAEFDVDPYGGRHCIAWY